MADPSMDMDYIKPPTMTPEEEAAEEKRVRKVDALKKQPTFHNEGR